jgi:beta-lactamase superfamily II metal-dependent hydrolase
MIATTLSILDVGHGNCAVLVDTGGVVVIDAGPGSALLEFLTREGVEKVDTLLISHADKDHIEGVIALLASGIIKIGSVRLNSDAQKGSDLWDDLLYALDKANTSGDLQLGVELTTNYTGVFDKGAVHIEVLAPSPYLAAKGPGARDRKGRAITANSISAVIRLVKDNVPIVLFPGDLDDVGLDNLLDSGVDPSAPLLAFPHHGGRPGKHDATVYTERLCNSVKPDVIVFSIERGGRFANPQPEIVGAIRHSHPKTHIICTQLSTYCAADIPTDEPAHLNSAFAKGREKRTCCAGTIVIDLSNVKLTILPDAITHQGFVEKYAPTALCRMHYATA